MITRRGSRMKREISPSKSKDEKSVIVEVEKKENTPTKKARITEEDGGKGTLNF